MTNTSSQYYTDAIKASLMKEFSINNPMEIPKMTKVVVNCGMGEAVGEKKVIEKMVEQLATLTGQKPVVTHAKKAIAAFKLREGDAIGIKVTLRKKRMFDFMKRLTDVALPRVRDFRGVPVKGFDGQGNYTLGIREQTIFPEIDYTMIDKLRGFEVTFVTTAQSNDQTKRLLELLGLPFEKVS